MDALTDRPPGLDAVEVLLYRRGYSKGCAKYLKDNGSPSMEGPRPTGMEFYVWRKELQERTAAFREGCHAPAHSAAMRELRAYWKRRELEPKVATPVRRAPARKPAAVAAVVTMVTPEDADTIMAVVGRASVVGGTAAHVEALSEVLGILGLSMEGAVA